jgi:hypothetical protein
MKSMTENEEGEKPNRKQKKTEITTEKERREKKGSLAPSGSLSSQLFPLVYDNNIPTI